MSKKDKTLTILVKLFVIDDLSGFWTYPQKEITFHNVTDNYIRHSGFITKNITTVGIVTFLKNILNLILMWICIFLSILVDIFLVL